MRKGLLDIIVLAFVSTATVPAAAADHPWWDQFPMIVSTDDLATAQSYAATVSFGGQQVDPSWGTYFEKLATRPELGELFHGAGMRTISYYEAYGTSTCFAAELGPRVSDLTQLLVSHWSWQYYGGGPIRWIGVNNFWDDEDYARPYTYTHPRYGAPRLTYPDGTIATGYNGPSTDPRNSRVFDACSAKDIYGNIAISYDYNAAVNTINPDTGQPVGPVAGLINTPGGYASHLSFYKDSACPYWADYTYASALMAADNGLDGMWTDNFSPWDSFGHPPLVNAFGDWSVAGFRQYLADHFSTESLQAMGMTDLQTFDIRAALRAKVRTFGGDDNQMWDGKWLDPRWRDDPLWRAYVIYKRETGTAALSAYYNKVKAAGQAVGKPDFFVCGNDIPLYGLGWPRGDLDMVSTEMSAGWLQGAGSRGIMLPPVGRFAPVYKLAREHARSRFVNVWFYVDDPYQAKEGIANVLQYEMLATHTLPMFLPDIARIAGTPASNGAFGRFVSEVRPMFNERIPAEEIGVYYSSSSILAYMTPGGFMNMDYQPHQFAVFGWGTALGELHYQYRFVPEWKLNSETLAGLRLLIIPDAEVLDPSDVADVITPWLHSGGTLIITGDSGARLGESGNFDLNPAGSSLAELWNAPGDMKVVHINENLGLQYYMSTSQRPNMLAQFSNAINQVMGGAPSWLLDASYVPGTVGLTVYQDEQCGQLFIDANNLDIELASDSITPAPAIAFTVARPAWLRGKPFIAETVSPGEADPEVAVDEIGEDRFQVVLSPFSVYASVVIQADTDDDALSDYDESLHSTNPGSPDTDSDGLTDGDEINVHHTNPISADSDGDGLQDKDEIAGLTDPNDPHDPAHVPVNSRIVLLALIYIILTAGVRKTRAPLKSPLHG